MKTIPRSWLDVTFFELFITGLLILNPFKLKAQNVVDKYEKELAHYCGTKNAVTCPNCRTGMYQALKSLRLEEGDEVIVPAFTWWTDAAVVVEAGLRPVFVDVDFNTRNIDTSLIESAITKKTKVIFVTHLNGLPANMREVERIAMEYKLRVIEDCARAFGAKYDGKHVGSFDIGVFSFGYGKSMYGIDGGAVVSNDDQFIERVREKLEVIPETSWFNLFQRYVKTLILKITNYPLIYRFTIFKLVESYYLKNNPRFRRTFVPMIPDHIEIPKLPGPGMINVQAQMCLWQLKRIDQSNYRRLENARFLTKELQKKNIDSDSIVLPVEHNNSQDVSVHYAVWSKNSYGLQEYLIKHHIDAQHETAMNLTEMALFSRWATGTFPNAVRLSNSLIFLPSHPSLKAKDLLYIVENVVRYDH